MRLMSLTDTQVWILTQSLMVLTHPDGQEIFLDHNPHIDDAGMIAMADDIHQIFCQIKRIKDIQQRETK